MFSIDAYLQRIQYPEVPKADLHSLRLLQTYHQLHVPFENLDIHLGCPIRLEIDRIADKVFHQKRGGFCYELNGLFYHLLKDIGFDVERISACVLDRDGNWGAEYDHLALRVQLDDPWLVDVGFGGFPPVPLKLIPGVAQQDWEAIYEITVRKDGRYMLLKTIKGNPTERKYHFSLQSRNFPEYASRCQYQQKDPQSYFRKHLLCSQAIPNGRKTLTDEKWVFSQGSEKIEQQIHTEAEFRKLLSHEFHLDLPPSHGIAKFFSHD